jgi:hypothetical protein
MLNYDIKLDPFFNVKYTIKHRRNIFAVFIHTHLMMVKKTEMYSVTAIVK